MIKKFKVTKEILAAACDKAWPYSKHCAVVRAIQVEYPNAESGGYFVNLGETVVHNDYRTVEYMSLFDQLAKKADRKNDGRVEDEESRKAIMALPEFEFELEIK